MADAAEQAGRVYLVGAGPGDPGLLTLRGLECLRRADVVLYDYLVNPVLVRHSRADAERICLGRHGRSRQWTQDEIQNEMVRHARAGRIVVRLKGGDPAVFGRVAEECAALRAAGIPFEIVPGITAALAAGSFAGIPITHREVASAVALVTGQEDADKEESSLDYAALARFPGTLVVYMGVTTVARWSAQLLAAGKPADTPVALVRRCSLPDQQMVRCTLGTVAQHLTPASKLRPPVIVIVGPVVDMADQLAWFDRRPLWGTSVLVSRPVDQADELADPLRERGAEVWVQPAITIGPPDDWTPVDGAIERMARRAGRGAPEFDWLVFSSGNGVRYFLDRIAARGHDLRILGGAKLAVIGPGTAAALADYRLQADLQPPEYRAESLAEVLAAPAQGKRCLLLRASRGRDVLPARLAQSAAYVEQVVVYASRDAAVADEEVRDRMRRGDIDWVAVTSSAIARSLATLFGDDLRRCRLVSISPLTSETLREQGFAPAAEAVEYTTDGLIAALEEAVARPA
ncbi:MAG: uroporphyrinogen-III C-methyltransferase [Pirellulales bacterium]